MNNRSRGMGPCGRGMANRRGNGRGRNRFNDLVDMAEVGYCGGERRKDGSGGGIGNKGTKRQPRKVI